MATKKKTTLSSSERKAIRAELKEVRTLETDMKRTLRKDLAEIDQAMAKLKRERVRLEKSAKPVFAGCERRRAILLGRL